MLRSLNWLAKDIVSVKYALLVALEERDNLLYIEEPMLKEEYMQKIGVYEEQVLKLELEVSLQEKKKQMIQTAINRREKIDLEAIDKALEEERAGQIEKLNRTFKVGRQGKSNLTEEDKVLETAIAGMHFHVEDEQEEENIENLVPGTELELYREPDNAYDEWAVAVYYGEEDLLGYITRYKNETIARLMDAGKKFIAVVDEFPNAKEQAKRK